MTIEDLVKDLCQVGVKVTGTQEEAEKHQVLLDELLLRANRDGLAAAVGTDQVVWDKLVAFALERRFGWSESTGSVVGVSENGADAGLAAKKRINDSLEQILSAFKKLPLSSPALVALAKAAPASQKPVVRQRAYLHVFEWLKRQAANDELEPLDSVLPTLKRIIVLGLTDVWSATRKACAEKLFRVAPLFSISQLESVFEHILDTYSQADEAKSEDNKDKWKEKEGCLMGVDSIIRQFAWTHDETGQPYMICFGANVFPCLPPFITDRLKELLFDALAHPQVSVRETAAKTFSSYLQRCHMDESFVCLDDVKNKLAGVALLVHEQDEQDERRLRARERVGRSPSDPSVMPHELPLAWKKLTEWSSMGAHVGHDRIVLLEACEAQGLLSMCSDLLKTLPSSHIVGQWPILFPTMNMYLAHSASTVRQACSSLFQCLMAKSDESSPMLQRLVLQSMATSKGSDSKPESKIEPRPESKVESKPESKIEASHAVAHTSASEQQQQQKQASRPDKKSLFFDDQASPSQQRHVHHSDHLDNTAVEDRRHAYIESSASHGGEVSHSVLWSSWEWHEGRLLAYELVLGHLVKDHTSNMFLCEVVCPSTSKSPPHDAHMESVKRHPASTPPHSHSEPLHSPQLSAQHNPSIWGTPIASPYASLSSPGKGRDGVAEPSLLDKLRDAENSSMPANIFTPQGEIIGSLQFEPLGTVLERIFVEVLHCAGDVRWELRRMALQVLPLLTVTAMWHDDMLLQNLWRRWLSCDVQPYSAKEPPKAYVAGLSIKEAVKRTLEYHDYVAACTTPLPRGCEVRTAELAERIIGVLPDLLVPIESLFRLQQPLKVCALGVELIILIHSKLPSVATPRQQEQLSAIVQWLSSLYSSAHDSSTLDQSPLRPALHLLEEASPIMGNATPDSGNRRSTRRTAENVERALIKSICPLLPDFVVTLDISQMMLIIPVLVRYMDLYKEDLEVELPLTESLHRIFSLPLYCWAQALTHEEDMTQHEAATQQQLRTRLEAVDECATPQSDDPPERADEGDGKRVPLDAAVLFTSSCTPAKRSQPYRYLRSGEVGGMLAVRPMLPDKVFDAACDTCVGGLLSLVSAQSTEIVLLRAVLAVLLAITKLVGDGRYLRRISEAVSTRLRTPIICSPLHSGQSPQHLQIMSNDISDEMLSPMASTGSAGSKRMSTMQPEQLFSSSIARAKARLGGDLTVDTSVDVGDEAVGGSVEDDEDSDWDDWSEDEDVSAVEGEVSAFLCAMRQAARDWGATSPSKHVTIAHMLNVQRTDSSGWDAQLAVIPSSVRGMVQRLAGNLYSSARML